DGVMLWSAAVDGSMTSGGGMRLDQADNVTIAGVFNSLPQGILSFAVSRISGVDGRQIWRHDAGPLGEFQAVGTVAVDGAADVYTVVIAPDGLRARKYASGVGAQIWEQVVWPSRSCRLAVTASAIDASGDVYFAAEIGTAVGATCADVQTSQHVFKLTNT